MTFDVSALPGRASELANIACEKVGPHCWDCWHLEEGDVSGLYDDFLGIPDPSSFASHTDRLLKAMEQLAPSGFSTNQNDSSGVPVSSNANSTLYQVSSAGDEIDDWTGTAADSFKKHYGDKFIPTISSQFVAAWVMRQALNAEAAIWQTVRDDLDKLSNGAIDKVKHAADCSKEDWTTVLTVAGAVVSVGGAIPSGGASLAGWAAVGAGVTVASTGMTLVGAEGKKDELGLSNSPPKQIVKDLKDRLSKIKEYINTHETSIANAIDGSLKAIDSGGPGWKEFCLPRPALADATRGNAQNEDNMGHVES